MHMGGYLSINGWASDTSKLGTVLTLGDALRVVPYPLHALNGGGVGGERVIVTGMTGLRRGSYNSNINS
jgi:hypothetical protein